MLLPVKSGVTGYTIQYRPINGNWEIAGVNIPPSPASCLNNMGLYNLYRNTHGFVNITWAALWDYPIKSDYHSLLIGARNAFVDKYGPKSAGGWKMKLMVSAFQAFRDNTCNEILRDQSNCGGSLARHYFIGDYLDAIDCNPYRFLRRRACPGKRFREC